MEVMIRDFKKEDACELVEIIRDNFTAISDEYYNRRQNMTEEKYSEEKLLELAETADVFTAYRGRNKAGFGIVENVCVGDHSYLEIHIVVAGRYHGKGVGRSIMEQLMLLDQVKNAQHIEIRCARDIYKKFAA